MLTDAKLPKANDPRLQDAMEKLGCHRVELVPIEPKPHARLNRCHANVDLYVNMYGGQRITGYYVAVSTKENQWIAVKHSVWNNDKMIDITPVEDQRTHNVFIWGSDQLYTEIYSHDGELTINSKVTYEDTFPEYNEERFQC